MYLEFIAKEYADKKEEILSEKGKHRDQETFEDWVIRGLENAFSNNLTKEEKVL